MRSPTAFLTICVIQLLTFPRKQFRAPICLTAQKMSPLFPATADNDFGDRYIDSSRIERRLIRV